MRTYGYQYKLLDYDPHGSFVSHYQLLCAMCEPNHAPQRSMYRKVTEITGIYDIHGLLRAVANQRTTPDHAGNCDVCGYSLLDRWLAT